MFRGWNINCNFGYQEYTAFRQTLQLPSSWLIFLGSLGISYRGLEIGGYLDMKLLLDEPNGMVLSNRGDHTLEEKIFLKIFLLSAWCS
jgi:hypothetical protein